MIYLNIALSAVFSFAVMFILAKLMGARQISQLSMFDYINGITIGSIAAELALAETMSDRLQMFAALVIYALATLLFSIITDKSIVARRFLTGKPARNLSLNTFSQIDTAVMEPNGKISFLPVSSARPATPADLGITVEQEPLCGNVIIDGNIMYRNLKTLGYNEEWLKNQLTNAGFPNVRDIFLATCRPDGTLCIYIRCGEACKEIFM